MRSLVLYSAIIISISHLGCVKYESRKSGVDNFDEKQKIFFKKIAASAAKNYFLKSNVANTSNHESRTEFFFGFPSARGGS